MSKQPQTMLDLYAAYDQLSLCYQTMDVVTVADTKIGHNYPLLFQIASARIRSSGVVILIFS